MARDGYTIIRFDGTCEQARICNHAQTPAAVFGVRPDVVGIDRNGAYAFGEAKTAEDIDCAHTRRQLFVLSRLKMTTTGDPCRIYISIPRSNAKALDRVLADLYLVGKPHIIRLHIPDILVTQQEVA
jgi:hypothetical protein